MLGSKMNDFAVNLTVLDITVLTIHGYKTQQQRSGSYRSTQSVKGNLRCTSFSNENSIKCAGSRQCRLRLAVTNTRAKL